MRRWPAALGVVIGLAIAAALIGAGGAKDIGTLLMRAGWGVALVVALHLPQTLFSAFGWRSLIASPKRPGLGALFGYRWIREAVNALLPVAQIGGDVVRARLLALRGVPLGDAAASCTVDLTMEMASQIAFSVLGVGLLLIAPHGAEVTRLAIAATLIGSAITLAFILAQRTGGLDAIGRQLSRMNQARRWSSLGDIGRFGPAMAELYGDRRRIGSAFLLHLTSWLLGALETYAGLSVLGLHAGLREAVVVESLGQIVRAMGFAIPGALGVQEGGYILICGLFGISPQGALALSLIRRIRELALGVPGLVAWQRIERRKPTARRDAFA